MPARLGDSDCGRAVLVLVQGFCILFFYVWARGTLPRFRYDQLMNFGWKLLLPVAIANLVVTAFIVMVLNR